MGKLFNQYTEQRQLYTAWKKIRENGIQSAALETRLAIEDFDRNVNQNIRRLQSQLRRNEFQFDPQKGVLKKKNSGGHRGIVMASVRNRVVERVLLNGLQKQAEFIKRVNAQQTSIGGVPNRSVPHGLALIDLAIRDGYVHFVRSDISGFFDGVPRKAVIEKISNHVEDKKFIDLLSRATEVSLYNENILGDDRKVFPTDDEGIAQGSPLSPLFGNVLLYEFDLKFNDRGIICIRFIDDFILLGRTEISVSKAFQSAKKYLSNLNLSCHDPFEDEVNLIKSQYGKVENGFDFLGYNILPGLIQPSRKSRKNILAKVDEQLKFGRRGIKICLKEKDSFANKYRYVQTLDVLDKVLRGWGNSFSYSNSASTMRDLDGKIDEKLNRFRNWYSRQVSSLSWEDRRRSGGVCLVSDISTKNLGDVPFVLEKNGKRFRQSKNTITISTDGSVIGAGKRRGRDKGFGGWGFIAHDTEFHLSGSEENVTNNQMELLAVVKALEHFSEKTSFHIRTDSQYVSRTINDGLVVKYNTDLWKRLETLKKGKSLKVSWVKGHNQDPFNEIADKLAGEAARKLRKRILNA